MHVALHRCLRSSGLRLCSTVDVTFMVPFCIRFGLALLLRVYAYDYVLHRRVLPRRRYLILRNAVALHADCLRAAVITPTYRVQRCRCYAIVTLPAPPRFAIRSAVFTLLALYTLWLILFVRVTFCSLRIWLHALPCT